MREQLFGILCALFIGVLGVVTWYAEMFTDNKAAALWRLFIIGGVVGV